VYFSRKAASASSAAECWSVDCVAIVTVELGNVAAISFAFFGSGLGE